MIYKVRLTEDAKQDLRDIYEYIAFSLFEPITAASVKNRIVDALNSLKEFPERYPIHHEEPWKSSGLRRINIKNYCAFYLIAEQTIKVVRICYGARDISNILESIENEEHAMDTLISELGKGESSSKEQGWVSADEAEASLDIKVKLPKNSG